MSDITPELLEKIRLANKKPRQAEDTNLSPIASSKEDAVLFSENMSSPDPTCCVREITNTSGNVIQKVPLKNGVIDGKLEIFNEKGNLTQSIPYENNVITGKMQGYDDLGSLLYEIPFIQGKKEGIGTFYMGGIKASDITFHNDQTDGVFIAYHSNGSISMQVSYKENHMDGELLAFSDNESLIKKETYVMGKKNGPSQSFYPSTKLYEEITFENNIPIHQSTTYHENQKPMMIKYYKDGKVVLTESYDDNGVLQKKEGAPNG